jgi:hypothetical protein
MFNNVTLEMVKRNGNIAQHEMLALSVTRMWLFSQRDVVVGKLTSVD